MPQTHRPVGCEPGEGCFHCKLKDCRYSGDATDTSASRMRAGRRMFPLQAQGLPLQRQPLEGRTRTLHRLEARDGRSRLHAADAPTERPCQDGQEVKMSNLKARKDAHTRDQYRKALTWFEDNIIGPLFLAGLILMSLLLLTGFMEP